MRYIPVQQVLSVVVVVAAVAGDAAVVRRVGSDHAAVFSGLRCNCAAASNMHQE